MSKLFQAKVVAKNNVADKVFEFEFEPTTQPLPQWHAGAHTDVHLPNGLIRQYSLMRSALNENFWRIAVLKEEQGRGGSKYLADKVEIGQIVSLGAPRNHFEFETSPDAIFIGAGIGITPLIEMVSLAESAGINWRLHYLGRSESHLAYAEELRKRFGDKVILNIAMGGTRLNLPEMFSSTPNTTHVYACGPERLLTELESMIGDSDCLHVERFTPKDQTFEADKPFTVFAQKSGIKFEVADDESILTAADFEGIEVEGDCLEGTCGSCETRIIEGDVEHRDSILTPKQQRENQTMMICISRAKGTEVILDL